MLYTIQAVVVLAKKSMNIELQEKISELRKEVLDLKEENIRFREEYQQIRQELEAYTKGDICPKCRKPAWELQSSRPHPLWGRLGTLEKTFKCGECGYSEDRID